MYVQINGTISKVQFILSEFYGLDLDITNLSLTNENAILLFFYRNSFCKINLSFGALSTAHGRLGGINANMHVCYVCIDIL